MTKEYFTHDNGGNPFRIVVDLENSSALVYKNYTKNIVPIYSVLNYTSIFIGTNDENKLDDGNSIIIETSPHKYTYIGSEIYTFATDEDILEYHSPIGNSDVPYPFAITHNNVYLMIEDVYFPISLTRDKEPYSVYYGHVKVKPSFDKKKVKKIIKKVLFGRTFG